MKQSEDYSKYILPVGLLVAGYIVLNKFGLFGKSAADNNSSSIASSTAAGTTAAINSEKAAGGFATLSAAEAASLANVIYNAGVSDPVDQDTIQNSLIQANTTTDILLIVQAFGTKQGGGIMCSIFGGIASSVCGTYDLSSWVRANLDYSHLASVDNYFSSQGINYYI